MMHDDKKLDALLDSYTVGNASDALMDRIAAAAQASDAHKHSGGNVTPLRPRRAASPFSARRGLERAAVFALVAVMGFWLGNVSHTTYPATSADTTMTAPAATQAAAPAAASAQAGTVSAATPVQAAPASVTPAAATGNTSGAAASSGSSDYLDSMLFGPKTINDMML